MYKNDIKRYLKHTPDKEVNSNELKRKQELINKVLSCTLS